MKTLNEITKENKVIKTLPSGDTLSINIFTIDSQKPGPVVYFQSSVHGSEHQGSAVIFTLMNQLKNTDFCGKAIFVPNANPYALNNKSGQYTSGRFDPTTGENWNRLYQNFTQTKEVSTRQFVQSFINDNLELIKNKDILKLKETFKNKLKHSMNTYLEAQDNQYLNTSRKLHISLQKLAIDADIVIDLHTGPAATRYLYSPEYLKNEYKAFCFPFNLIIPEKFWGAMDEVAFIPWFNLMDELEKTHQITTPILFSSYTLELGSEESLSFEEAQKDSIKIINYLNSKNMEINIENTSAPTDSYSCKLKDFKTYYNDEAGLYDFIKPPGSFCRKGEVMAKAINFAHVYMEDISFDYIAKNDCIIINHFSGASVPEGSELFQVMENYSKA